MGHIEVRLDRGSVINLASIGAGKILETGKEIKDIYVGDKVLLSFASCGTCDFCRYASHVVSRTHHVDRHPTTKATVLPQTSNTISDTHSAYCCSCAALNLGGSRADGSSPLSLPATNALVHGHFFGQTSFTRRAVAHGSSLVKAPPATDLDLFAHLDYSLQTGAGCILNTLDVPKRQSVVVFSAGGVASSGPSAVPSPIEPSPR